MPLSKVTPKLLQNYRRVIEASTSPATTKRKVSSLRRYFDWAEKRGYLEKNPLVQEKPKHSFLSAPSKPIPKPQKPTSKVDLPVNLIKWAGMTALSMTAFVLSVRLVLPLLQPPPPVIEEEPVTEEPSVLGTEFPSHWTIFARFILKDTEGNPFTNPQTITYNLYTVDRGGLPVWTSQPYEITPDINGGFFTQLSDVPINIFFENEKLFLAATTPERGLAIRLPVSTANTPAGSEGYSPVIEIGTNNIPVISDDGSLLLASETPVIKAKSGPLVLEGQAVTITGTDTFDGDITLNPDGSGNLNLLFEGSGGNMLHAQAANLNSGSLIAGDVANDSVGYYLINLQSGSDLISRFSVDEHGNTAIQGRADIKGTEIMFDSDTDADNVLQFSAASGSASHDLYWGEDLLCDVSEDNCGRGGSNSPFTDGTGITFRSDFSDDFTIGGESLIAPFSVDESANTVRIGEGTGGSVLNAVLSMYASDDSSGSITYTTDDLWQFSGGGVVFDIPTGNAAVFQGAFSLSSQQILPPDDTTPSVAAGSHFITASTANTVIADFDNGTNGQILAIEIGETKTDFDCTGSNLNCGSTDITGSTAGDMIYFIYNGTNWNLIEFLDLDGNQNNGADLAEFFPSNQSLLPGEIVRIDPDNPVYVSRSTTNNEPGILGVISTNPGLTLGEEASNTFPIALAGRVPVRITNEGGAISAGDYVTSSSLPGVAMKAINPGPVIGQALESWEPESDRDSIQIFVNPAWYNPQVLLSTAGDFYFKGQEELIRQADVEQETGFSQLIAANISAGAVRAVNLTTEGFFTFQAEVDDLLVNNRLVSSSLETGIISPLADSSDIRIQIGSKNDVSDEVQDGKLVIENAKEEEVASIDSQGNAVFSGEIEAESVVAEKLVTNELINKDTNHQISLEEIERLLQEAESNQELLASAEDWPVEPNADSASLGEMVVDSLFVTDSAAVSSLSVTSSIALGADLVFSSQMNQETNQSINTIDSLTAPLSIQSLALAPIEMMAGLIHIDINGDISILGNLSVAERIESGGLTLAERIPFSEDSPKEIDNLLSLRNQEGQEVANINTLGSADFSQVALEKLIIAGADSKTTSINSSGEIETNAVAGKTVLKSGETEITINNQSVSDHTLVYITPTSPTGNQVLFVKSKNEGSFKVGLTNAIDQDIEFNWWLIDLISNSTETDNSSETQ